MKLSGWGRFPVHDCRMIAARDDAEVLAHIAEGPLIARGNGRAYGDSALNPAATLDMRKLDRMLAFDPASGQLVAEAGVLLADVIATFLPRGWFPFVTPGTRFVTLGGMIAADVHGKNHHKDGGFANFVDWIDLACADGEVRRCSRAEDAELFEWTIGGMGLTGVVLRAAFRLRPVESGWLRQRTIPAPDLASAMRVFEDAQDATYSVAWIDCLATGSALGRSLIMLGEHAGKDELPADIRRDPFPASRKAALRAPFDFPAFALNRVTVGLFNQLYYRVNGRRSAREQWIGWDRYFYPLDAIGDWNRIYGRRGFMQFQCVLPLDTAEQGLRGVLDLAARAGSASFLAVLKRFGAAGRGLSFPMPGYTLTLDFPVSRRSLTLMDRLDELVVAHGGRFYLAKDGRMSADALRRADPRAASFNALRRNRAMAAHFHSMQSERLKL